ncbi:MAG: phage minor capsid protein [Oscillospiraceae bacterium]
MGLSPEYYDGCTDDVLNLYAELEDRIIADVVRRIIKTGDITETAKWQIRQAQQMGLLYDDIIKDIAKSTNKTDSEIKKMFENAGVETVNNDNRIHIQAGKSPLDIHQSESMLQILNGVYQNSLTDLKNLTGTTAITSQTAYYNACNSAFMMVSSGAFSYQQALRTVIQEVGKNGATVSYPSGHVDRLDVAVRRSLLTGVGLASRQISEENSRLCGCDLMEISAHSGARPSHASWQGQIVSLSGRRGYLSKSDIGYGTGAGFGGWNCRHDWYPFYEGISKRNYSQKDLDNLNAKDIKYNGKMYSEYEISQMLRQKERDIRALKREKVALKTAIEEGQTFLKSDLTALNSKIREKSNQIQEFCNQTGYNRDRFREQVGGKTSVGHTSKNYQNGLTSLNVDGILNVDGTSNNFNKLSNKNNSSNNSISKNDDNPYGFNKIIGDHSREDDLKNTNPKGDTNNCVLCCVAYEGRRRNFDVVAKSKDPNLSNVKKSGWRSAFKNSIAEDCSGTSSFEVYQNISNKMNEWYAKNQNKGTVRAVIMVHWKGTNLSHAFIVEKDENGIIFLDPQTNEKYVDYYIYDDNIDLNLPLIVRIDNLEFTDNIIKCCENRSELK